MAGYPFESIRLLTVEQPDLAVGSGRDTCGLHDDPDGAASGCGLLNHASGPRVHHVPRIQSLPGLELVCSSPTNRDLRTRHVGADPDVAVHRVLAGSGGRLATEQSHTEPLGAVGCAHLDLAASTKLGQLASIDGLLDLVGVRTEPVDGHCLRHGSGSFLDQ